MKLRHLVILFILILPVLTPLLHPGYWGASDEMHIAWLQQMDRAVQSAKFPPRYVPDLSYGFGYPLFNFVFPLPFYLGEVFHLLGASFVVSLKLVFLTSFLASALAMYALARRFASSRVAILAALVYTYTPYRSTDIYVRGAVGEAFGFIFLPLIILSLYQVCTSSSRKWLGIGALSLAGLILSHDITAYMFVPFAIVFTLFFIRKSTLIPVLKLAVLGLLTSLYFWLPALRDSLLMKHDTVFNFADHFPNLSRLITPYWGYGASMPVPNEGMSFYIGSANLFFLFTSFLFLLVFYRRLKPVLRRLIFFLLLLVLCAVFMMNYRATFLWQHLPLIPYFQFPWRFLIITTFATSGLVVIFNPFIKRRWYLPFLLLAAILVSYTSFSPQDYLNRDDTYYLSRYIPVPAPSFEYTQIQEEYLRLPKSTLLRPGSTYPRFFPQFPNITAVSLNPFDTALTTNSSTDQFISLNKYLFPGFTGSIDGRPLVLLAGKPFGQISFTVPAGSHQIMVTYSETVPNLLLDFVSLGSLIIALYLILKPYKS